MGGRQSSVDPSSPTILQLQVRIPGTTSKLFFNYNFNVKINKKRQGSAIFKKPKLIDNFYTLFKSLIE